MKKYLLLLLFASLASFGQNPESFRYGIKPTEIFTYASGILPINGGVTVNSTSQAFVLPRMTTAQKNAIVTPTTSALVYDTTLGKYQYYNGTAWVDFGGGGGFTSLQQMHDDNPDNTKLTSGSNVLTLTPTDLGIVDGSSQTLDIDINGGTWSSSGAFGSINSGAVTINDGAGSSAQILSNGFNGVGTEFGYGFTNNLAQSKKIISGTIDGEEFYQLPNKPDGTYTLATTADIGGGAVDSVNTQTGVVVLDADDISDTSTTNKWTNATEKATWNNGITGQITIISSDGTRQIITPSLDTNASRGTALQSAKTSAVSGDVIFVNNGVYDTYDLAKDGITYYFEAGAVIESTENTAQSFIFSDNGSAITFKVLGDGVFRHLGTGTQENIVHNTAASNFYIEAYSMYSQYGRITQNYAADLTIKAHTLSGALGVDIIGNTDLNTKTTVYADLLSVTSGYALEHDGGILSAYVKEIVNTGSVTAITTETGLGTLYIETAKITSNSAFPLEIFNVDTNVIIVGAQIFATGSHYYTTSNSLYFSGCYDEDFNTTLTGTGTPIYLTTSGGGGGTIDPVPTDGSTNAVESNGVFDALATKQATLVSGTNIKTVGGVSLLGSGNLTEVQNSLTASAVLAPSVDAVNTGLETKENATNKQNSLATDGTGVKFPTVDAVNTALALKQDNPNVILNLTDYPTAASVTTLHVVSSHQIPANTLSNNSILKYMTCFDRTGTAGNSSMGIYLDTSAGTIGSAVSGTAVLIAAATTGTTGRMPNFERTFKLVSNLLTGYPSGVNSPTDAVVATSALTSTPLTPSTTYYLITAVINNSAADVITQRMTSLTQRK